MREVINISRGRLMAMQVGIAVLLIFLIGLFLKLREEPKIPPDFGEFQRVLETSTGAIIIDITGKVTAFDSKLRLVDQCGEVLDDKPEAFPAPCRPKKKSVPLFKNDLNLLGFGKETELTDVILGTRRQYFKLPPPRCSDGSLPPC